VPYYQPSSALFSTLQNNDDSRTVDPSFWLEQAAKLRAEAASMEKRLRLDPETGIEKPTRRSSTSERDGSTSSAVLPPVEYKDLCDSVWSLTYRFTRSPMDDEGNQNTGRPFPFTVTATPTNTASTNRIDSFGGKMTLRFRADGYTDLLSHEATTPQKLEAVKAWGWDVEAAAENNENDDNSMDKQYVLFSVDFNLPEDGGKQRYYFQARQRQRNDQTLYYEEGMVTMKQDIGKTPNRGFLQLFSPGGILAQFRYVGNYVARPTRVTDSETGK
jgi:hypothetical protein